MCDECHGKSDEEKKNQGRKLLNWSFFEAPNKIEDLAPTVTSPSYIRGTYHVLSIDGQVGWHPDYLALLGFRK
jgi:hypothetical protein